MATSNYYNNDNGIFIVPNSESKDFMEDELNDFQILVIDTLTAKGYTVQSGFDEILNVYKGDLIVATIDWRCGYYAGVQAVVTTDKYDLEYEFKGINGYYNDMPYKWYTPYHKDLLNIIKGLTGSYKVVARFSNGETIYQKD